MAGLADLFDEIKPRTPGQEALLDALRSDKDLVGVFGPTGTGKSFVSALYGISSVARGDYDRFVVARPIIDVTTGQEITITNNPEAYKRLAVEYLVDLVDPVAGEGTVEKLVEEGKIVVVDPHLLRGRTFDNSLILLDDVQNAAPETVVEIITRLGVNSRLIIAGDPVFQKERHHKGAILAREILMGEETAEVVDLGIKDIVRPGARRGIRLLLELQVRKRELDDVERRIYDIARVKAPDADIVTVAYLADIARKWGIESDHVPDALIIVKQGHLGRIIGKGGERIEAIEEEAGMRVRAVELTLDFKEYIRAFHPVSWIHARIEDFDFAGPELRIVIPRSYLGPMLGQGGSYIKFVDEVFRKIFGFGVYVVESESRPKRKRKKR